MIQITDKDFQKAINGEKLVVVEFMATWCGPCKQMKKIYEEVYQEMHNDVMCVACDVDEAPDACVEYQIRSVPTFIFFRDGQPVKRLSGAISKLDFAEMMAAFIQG